MPLRITALLAVTIMAFWLAGCAGLGDPNVVVSSTAAPAYTKEKFAGAPKLETYVFMPGLYFSGATVDRSLDLMPFRSLAEQLAPELAKQNYLPAKDLASADLLIVVHWGVTTPKTNVDELLGRSTTHFDPQVGTQGPFQQQMVKETPLPENSQIADYEENYSGHNNDAIRSMEMDELERRTQELGGDLGNSATHLLGYTRHLQRMAQSAFASTEEETLRVDLRSERYFVVLRAYDLRKMQNKRPRIAWTLHLNMRSPGQNFRHAMVAMSNVAVNYFGRETSSVETSLPGLRQGEVTIGEITIVGER